MSETPERIEREMFEIRSGMASDMTDLRQHVDPQIVADQVKQTARQRLQEVLTSVRAILKTKQQEFLDSARHQASLAREAGENRDPAPLTDAVKSDPRPLALLAIGLAVAVFTIRKITGGGRDE